MHLVKVENGEFVRALGNGPARSVFRFHAPTGRVAVCGGKSMQIIAADTGRIVSELPGRSWPIAMPGIPAVTFWRSGATTRGSSSGTFTPAQSMVYPHRGMPAQIVFNRDGSQFFSFSIWDGHFPRLWDVGTAQSFFRHVVVFLLRRRRSRRWQSGSSPFPGERGRGRALAARRSRVSPAGSRIASAPWSLLQRFDQQRQSGARPGAKRRLGAAGICDSLQRVAHWSGGACSTAFDSDDNLLTACEFGIYRWPRRAEATLRSSLSSSSHPVAAFSLGPPERLTGPMNVTSLAASLDGRMLVFEQNDGFKAMRLDSPDENQSPGTPRSTKGSDQQRPSPDRWPTGAAPGTSVWMRRPARPSAKPQTGMCGAVQFSPDGRWLATSPHGVRLWRVADWQIDRELHLKSTTPNGMGMTSSPDSRVLLIGDPGGVLRLLDPTERRTVRSTLASRFSSGLHPASVQTRVVSRRSRLMNDFPRLSGTSTC